MSEWTEDDVRRLIVNPFYAIEIDEALAQPHPLLVSEEQWVAANVSAIEDDGAEVWLRALLDVLKGDYVAAP